MRPLRSLVPAIATASLLAALCFGNTACSDPRSLDWQIKHLNDSNALDRGTAIKGIGDSWRAVDQSGDEAKRKEFIDKAVDPLVKAYTSDALKDSTKDRGNLMEVISQIDDPRIKPAVLFAVQNYAPGENDGDAKAALRSIVKMKDSDAFKGDAETGKALVAGLNACRPVSKPGSLPISGQIGDAISGLKIGAAKQDLLNIVKRPNDGQETSQATADLTGIQVVAAQALGVIGDESIVGDLVDAMFDTAPKMTKVADKGTGINSIHPSRLTSALSQVLGGSLARIGRPALATLMPYLQDDQSNPKVKAVADKFKDFAPGGYVESDDDKTVAAAKQPQFYVTIASNTIANIGLPEVAGQIKGILDGIDATTKDDKQKDKNDAKIRPLVGLLVSLPADDTVIAGIKEAYDKSSKLKDDIAGSVMSTMESSLTDWLVGIASDKKVDGDAKSAALNSAVWLAPPDKFDSVVALYDAAKLKTRDTAWRVMIATKNVCDLAKGMVTIDGKQRKLTDDEKKRCSEEPDPDLTKGVQIVLYDDQTPTFKEEYDLVNAVVDKCKTDSKCYLQVVVDQIPALNKADLSMLAGKSTREGANALIQTQKAMWMLAEFGTEDDLSQLVQKMPDISAMNARAWVQMVLDKGTATRKGSIKIADAIDALVKAAREKADATANRDAAQLDPIANKLRVRAGAATAK